MSPWLLTGVVLLAVAAAAGAALWQRRQDDELAPPPPDEKRWQDDRITPVALGPRNRVRERVARGPALSQVVMLAVEMARADGEVHDQEIAAIREFLISQVTEADDTMVEQVMAEGLAATPTPASIEAAIDTIRAISSEEQRRLFIQLLVHVAQADGHVHADEIAFMERVGGKMGLSGQAVADLIRLP